MVANKQIFGLGSISGPGNIMGELGITGGNLSGYGSLVFDGNTSTQLNYIASPLASTFGSSAWTVEWWQYETDNNGAPRPWAIGPWSGTDVGVSLEGSFYVWLNGGLLDFGDHGDLKNKWVNFAVVYNNGTYSVFKNGSQLGSSQSGSSISVSDQFLTLGGEGGSYSSQTFGGYITGFKISDTAKYSSSYSVSRTVGSQLDSNTVILLMATSAETKNNITGSVSTPNVNDVAGWISSNPWLS